jgi:hypothetical protein
VLDKLAFLFCLILRAIVVLTAIPLNRLLGFRVLHID